MNNDKIVYKLELNSQFKLFIIYIIHIYFLSLEKKNEFLFIEKKKTEYFLAFFPNMSFLFELFLNFFALHVKTLNDIVNHY